ncbi:hypothetical protein E2P81_ATG08882 [Venturia nashicola]|uniref:Uncharacterized protein n=1 Tax=Venturia nashicola TaxID=86259 RepID=A0A4Z1NJS6_9PEZI|nr:hypothetical protein E6O75_ATG09079 [Venturia nashicola]TLD23538.1 hypothetical protein E2P81_ATG08882 [Venturia nashicola]
MPFEDYGIIMYPPSQTLRQYYDASSSETISIHDEDEAFLEKPITVGSKTNTWRQSYCCTSTASSIIISIITTLALLLLIFTTTHGHPTNLLKNLSLDTSTSPSLHDPSPPKEPLHCGTSPSQARALGCKFDLISFAWTPPSCYNATLSHSFITHHGPWTFYKDHNATMPLAVGEVEQQDVVWAEHGYHVVHCLYAWERLHWALSAEGGGLVPGEIGSLNHTVHCVGLLGKGEVVELRKVNTKATLVFDGCVVV